MICFIYRTHLYAKYNTDACTLFSQKAAKHTMKPHRPVSLAPSWARKTAATAGRQGSSSVQKRHFMHSASAATHVYFVRCACVLRPRYVCASAGVHVCFGRCACVLRSKQMGNAAVLMKRYDRSKWKMRHFADASAALRHDASGAKIKRPIGMLPFGSHYCPIKCAGCYFNPNLALMSAVTSLLSVELI